jgi:outer membrane lipoprotein SlyB
MMLMSVPCACRSTAHLSEKIMQTKVKTWTIIASLTAMIFPVAPALAAMSATELAKLAQNPVGNLISVPFQNNTNLNYGPEKKTQNVLNIQPVIPVSVNSEWNIITRTILPVISMPALSPDDDRTNGIGDTQFTAFLSPANPGHWIWGAGGIVQLPTHSDQELGNDNWGLGGIAGLGLGSLIGGGTGRDVAMLLGAVGGAVAGNAEQKKYDAPKPGQQIIVRTTSGVLVSVTQPVEPGLQTGEKVYIEGNGENARVRPQ